MHMKKQDAHEKDAHEKVPGNFKWTIGKHTI